MGGEIEGQLSAASKMSTQNACYPGNDDEGHGNDDEGDHSYSIDSISMIA